ncbi:hypothetical protein KKA39_00965 [Patescibacteria group bacterium]|nr:hypothetical protein [Patescibacteria group bacterium]
MKLEKRILSVARRNSAAKISLAFSIPPFLLIMICSLLSPDKLEHLNFVTLSVISFPLCGLVIGFYSKKVWRWEISRWRKKTSSLKYRNERIIQELDSRALYRDAKKRLEGKERKIKWLKLLIAYGRKEGNDVTEYREALRKIENTEVIDDDFLDYWNNLRREWSPELKKIRMGIKKYGRRIAVFDKILVILS